MRSSRPSMRRPPRSAEADTVVRVGILETDVPPPALQDRFGASYAPMMARMLGEGFVCEGFDVTAGQYPADPEAYAAYVITGSSAGVYDPLPWIAPLEDFLRRVRGRAKLVGICFGHQIMAQAFGGTVRRSEKGTAHGLHHYAVTAPEPWMDGAASIAIAVSHQDQVIDPPAEARVLGGSAFTPNGVLAYGADAVSFQCHPEFEPAFAAALIELRRASFADPAEADALIASLQGDNDRSRVADWIRAFLQNGPAAS